MTVSKSAKKKSDKSGASWNTSISPNTTKKNYKTWAIAMTVAVTVLTIVVAVLAVAIAVIAGDKRQDKPTDAKTSVESNEDVPLAQAGDVDISGLDGSKLIIETDLAAGEIPDHYVGNKDAPVVVIEYEDFACSHCQALAATAEQIHDDYGDRVLFIHRSFSLGFPNSDKTLQSAEAAYLVNGQNGYWAMNRLLYQDAKFTGGMKIGQAVFNSYAEQIGIDSVKFKKALAEVAIANKIERDKQLGVQTGVTGTPAWLVNGQQVSLSDDGIRAALDAAL